AALRGRVAGDDHRLAFGQARAGTQNLSEALSHGVSGSWGRLAATRGSDEQSLLRRRDAPLWRDEGSGGVGGPATRSPGWATGPGDPAGEFVSQEPRIPEPAHRPHVVDAVARPRRR